MNWLNSFRWGVLILATIQSAHAEAPDPGGDLQVGLLFLALCVVVYLADKIIRKRKP